MVGEIDASWALFSGGRFSTVPAGSLAKASSVGANTVERSRLERVHQAGGTNAAASVFVNRRPPPVSDIGCRAARSRSGTGQEPLPPAMAIDAPTQRTPATPAIVIQILIVDSGSWILCLERARPVSAFK